jgi:acetolactate synthase-1/2/3 large subunit
MKVSDVIAFILAKNNVTHGFELIGGMITHLIDSINNLGETKLISMHHEQAAAFAAGGVARSTNNKELGLALGTSGPGATNLITGIAECWFDSVPCIFLTGQVNRHEMKGKLNIRQQGFQELDIVSLVSEITKYAYLINDPNEVVKHLHEAIREARGGRPGPVLLDIPMDVQRCDIEFNPSRYQPIIVPVHNHKYDFKILVEAIEKSTKPLVLIGGGAVNEIGFNEFLNSLNSKNIPYVSSLKGAEKCNSSDSYLGMLGAYGTRCANYAVQNCDLLIVLGSRLDVRQTGSDTIKFASNANVIQIDIDEGQINNRIKSTGILVSCAEIFVPLIDLFTTSNKNWISELNKIKSKFNFDEYSENKNSPYQIFECLNNKILNKKLQITADVGNNQMWAAHSLKLNNHMCHCSAGLGAMGFSLPTSIGVQVASNLPTISINGDGGVQLNIQELDIINRENLPILVIVFNNFSLGMVKGFQDLYFEGRNKSTYWDKYSCSFTKIASGYGLESHQINSLSEFSKLLDNFLEFERPMFIEFLVPDAKECKPRLEFGNTLDKQSPLIK